MAKGKISAKLNRISECLKNKDYSNPELTGAKIISLCIIALLLVGLIVLVTRIDSISIEGDVTLFNESEIVEASELSVGGALYSKPEFVIKRAIRKNLPMAEKVSVRKNIFTRRVTIRVEFSEYEFVIQHGDKFYGVDSNLTVVDIRDSKLEFVALGGRVLTLPEVEAPVLGEKLIFTSTIDIRDENGRLIQKGDDISKYSYVTELLGFLSRSGYIDRTDAVFLDEKFNVRLIMDGRCLVYIGRCESLETKFEVVDAIIDEGSTAYGKGVVINVQNPALASARVDNELDFSEYVVEGKYEASVNDDSENPTKAPSE